MADVVRPCIKTDRPSLQDHGVVGDHLDIAAVSDGFKIDLFKR
jgi:hypothetical protein